MPIKRRRDKSRTLTSGHLEDLLYGPGTCLFNGEGYLGPYGDGFWRDKSEAVQMAVLAEMADDWERHSAQVLAAWDQRSEHEIQCARAHHGDPKEPWALREFGTIDC
ncbi:MULTISPECIES: hypothetical protein [unclassified Sphingobium]|uniref:hypothetical protein n=1 Tax=unclassified Sphingobium TaxID=2611147 RepID=UPI0035A6A3D3